MNKKYLLFKAFKLYMTVLRDTKLPHKLYHMLTAYNKLLRHILRLKGSEVDAISLY